MDPALDAIRRTHLKSQSASLREWWWCVEPSLSTIAQCLHRDRYVIVDDFLPITDAKTLAQQTRMVEESGHFTGKGTIGGGRLGRDLTSKEVNASIRGDTVGYFDGDEPQWLGSIGQGSASAASLMKNTLDKMNTLVCEMRDLKTDGSIKIPASIKTKSKSDNSNLSKRLTAINSVKSELRNIHTRSKAMVSCYKGANKAFYSMHCDNANRNGRKLTVILYLNENWGPKDGGLLVIHPPTALSVDSSAAAAASSSISTPSKVSIVPSLGRLVLFWSNLRCPHEVMPVVSPERDRYAITLWFVDSLEKEDALIANRNDTGNTDNTDNNVNTDNTDNTDNTVNSATIDNPDNNSDASNIEKYNKSNNSVSSNVEHVPVITASMSIQNSDTTTTDCRTSALSLPKDFDNHVSLCEGGIDVTTDTSCGSSGPTNESVLAFDPPESSSHENEFVTWNMDTSKEQVNIIVLFKSPSLWDNRSQIMLDVNEMLIIASISPVLLPHRPRGDDSSPLVLFQIRNLPKWSFSPSSVVAKFKKGSKQMNITIANSYIG